MNNKFSYKILAFGKLSQVLGKIHETVSSDQCKEESK